MDTIINLHYTRIVEKGIDSGYGVARSIQLSGENRTNKITQKKTFTCT